MRVAQSGGADVRRSGLLLCLIFTLLPRRWTMQRDWQAVAVMLCAVIMAISPVLAVSQMSAATQMTTETRPEAPPATQPAGS